MNRAQPTLSAIVITRNEAHNLHDCLQSLHGLVDEIIVVDSQSTDATVAIAQQHGAKVAQPEDGLVLARKKIVRLIWPRVIGCFR